MRKQIGLSSDNNLGLRWLFLLAEQIKYGAEGSTPRIVFPYRAIHGKEVDRHLGLENSRLQQMPM